MRRRISAVATLAVASVLAATACGGPGAGGAATTPPTGPAPAAPLTCANLRNAPLGSASVPYNGYPDSIPLSDGIWAGEDGVNVEFRECAVGDLNGDGAADGLGSVVLSTGGTAHFYSVAAWVNVGGEPVFTALVDLGDREPVLDLAIAGQKATVVYLTRTPGLPPAEVNLKRTIVYRLIGSGLVEQGRNDVPYTP